jgi:hypothetical protein
LIFLLRGSRKQKQHNEKREKESKIAPPMAPKDNGARSRLRDVQCRSSTLQSQLHDLGNAKQGKYGEKEKEEEKRKTKRREEEHYIDVGDGLCVTGGQVLLK